jgi:hypothetical protein
MKRATWYPAGLIKIKGDEPAIEGMATLVGDVAYPSHAMAKRILAHPFYSVTWPSWIKIGSTFYPWRKRDD